MRELTWTREGDVYSFGVVAAEVFHQCKHLPFHGLSNESLVSVLADARCDLAAVLFRDAFAPAPLCGMLLLLFLKIVCVHSFIHLFTNTGWPSLHHVRIAR